MDRGAVRLLSVRGVPLRVHWSLLLILPYLVVVLALQFGSAARLAGVNPSRVALPAALWGLILALALFASVALHELAHTLVALRSGGRVRSITLMMLGGVSEIETLSKQPRVEAVVSIVGPVASLVIAGVAYGLFRLTPAPAADLRLGLYYLAYLNLVLGVFNLLPVFPMDGGRVLRALLAVRWGRSRATRTAATLGKVLAVGLGLLGVFSGAILLILISVFVYFGAAAEGRQQLLLDALGGLTVADVMTRHPSLVRRDAPLVGLPESMRATGRLEVIVPPEGPEGPLVVSAEDLLALPVEERERLSVRDIAARLSERAVMVSPAEPVADAIDRAAGEGARYLVAVEDAAAYEPAPPHEGSFVIRPAKRITGLVGPAEISRAFALRSLQARQRRARRDGGYAPLRPSET